MGLNEMAVAAYRRVVQIGPRMAAYFKKQKESSKMPAAIVDEILADIS